MQRLVVAGILLLALCATSYAARCGSEVSKVAVRSRIRYEVFGNRLLGQVTDVNGVIPGHSLQWTIDKFVERKKLILGAPDDPLSVLTVGPTIPVAALPALVATGHASVDPLEERVSGRGCTGSATSFLECGDLVDWHDAADWECSIVQQNTTIEGHELEVISVTMINPNYPTYPFISNYYLPYKNFSYVKTFPSGASQQIDFVENSLKVNYEMPNGFPFANNDTAQYWELDTQPGRFASSESWLALWWNLTVINTEDYDVRFSTTDSQFAMTFGPPELFRFTANVALFGFVDGKPTNQTYLPGLDFPYVMAKDVGLDLNFGLVLTAGNTSHFESMWYDPTFAVLFAGGDPTKPQTPQQKRVANSQRIVVAVVVSVVVVVVLLVVLVPTVALVFRPYLARRRARGAANLDNAGGAPPANNTEQPEGKKEWTKPSKPANI